MRLSPPASARARARDRRERRGLSNPSLHRLYQHRAAQPAADAFGGDAAPRAEPLHRIDEVQHDAVAAGADGMAKRDGAAIDIELGAIDFAGRSIEAQNLLAE